MELQAAGSPLPYEHVLQDIEARDAADYSRPVGALKKVCELLPRLRRLLCTASKPCSASPVSCSRQVEGAVELDSSSMSFQQVVDAVVDVITQHANIITQHAED